MDPITRIDLQQIFESMLAAPLGERGLGSLLERHIGQCAQG